MKIKTKKTVTRTLVLKLSVDEAQLLHSLLYDTEQTMNGAGWEKDDSDYEEVLHSLRDMYRVLDEELWK